MRRSWFLILLALAPTLGCGDSRSVRVRTPLADGSVQDQLDGVAEVFFSSLLGGSQ